jgi:hypothetical protein
LLLLNATRRKRYLSGAVCYLRARSLGYRKQRLPVISRAVEDRFGHFWVPAFDCRRVISYPARGLAGSLVKLRCSPVAEPFNLLAWCLAPHFDGNRAVRQRVLQLADLCNRHRAMRRERARLEVIANGANNLAAATMAGIQDPAQFLVFAKECIGLVNQQCWTHRLDCPEGRGG